MKHLAQWGLWLWICLSILGAFFYAPFFGYSTWTPATVVWGAPYELALVLLNGDGGTPTEDATWSSIKDLYR